MPPKEDLSTQVLEREARGLMLHPNPYSLPEGALLEANNVVIDRPGVISKARGLNRYGDALSNPPTTLAEFDDTVIVQDGSTLKYDSDGAGTWSSLSGTFSAPDVNNRIRYAEALFALFFTTSEGLYRLDALTGTPTRAGMPQGLDLQDTFTGTGLGWFTPATQVGYKIVWIRKDANDQEIYGAPSFREVIKNPYTAVTWTNSGTTVTVTHTSHGYSTEDTIQQTDLSDADAAVDSTITVSDPDTYTYTSTGTAGGSGTASHARTEDVQLVSTIPDDVAAGDFYEIYRTQLSADINTDPGGRYLKVNRVEVDASDITAGTVTFADDFDPAFLGQDLYDNPTAEGSDQSNYRSPFFTDVTLWKGHLWGCNTRQPHRLQLQFLTINNVADGSDTITIGGITYTFEDANDIGNQEFRLEDGLTTEAENVAETMRNLCLVANRDTNNTAFYLHYISGPTDAPGQILIERRDLTNTALAVTANDTGTGGSFSPVLPTSGSTVATEATQHTNRLQRSKFEEPDAWPLLNFDDLGSPNSKILRIVPLRDSLMAFTERGIYRVSGDTEADFSIRNIETDIQLLAPESPAVLNDSIWAYTDQGIVSINENGAKVRSFYGIERELQKIQTFTNFKTHTWGISYDEDHKYILWAQSQSGDSSATVGWVWNDFTQAWTKRIKKVTCGVVTEESNLLFLGHAVDSYVLKERKSFNTSAIDFTDEDIDITITAVSTGTHPSDATKTVSVLTFSYTYAEADLTTEFGIKQNTDFGRVLALTDNGSNSYTATLDTLGANWSTGAAFALIPIISRVRWAPEVMGDASKKKQFTYAALSLEADTVRAVTLKFVSDVIQDEVAVNPVIIAIAAGWGSIPWGTGKWGSGGPKKSTPVRVPIPRRCQRCGALSTIFEHSRSRSFFDIVNLGLTSRLISPRINFNS